LALSAKCLSPGHHKAGQAFLYQHAEAPWLLGIKDVWTMGTPAPDLDAEKVVEASLIGDQRYFASSGRNTDSYIL
jgi:hypothetical protein